MREDVDSRTGKSRFVVFAGLEGWPASEVYVIGKVAGGEPVPLTPDQARGMGEALLRAANEAESGASEEARVRTEPAAFYSSLGEPDVIAWRCPVDGCMRSADGDMDSPFDAHKCPVHGEVLIPT